MKTHHVPTITIKASKGWASLELGKLWEYRELIGFFAMRDISLRYRQTMAGVGWAIIQPVVMMIIFSLLFSKLGKFSSEGVPYDIFCFAGLIPWQYVSTSVGTGSMSLVNNPQLITKVYFPRLVIPIASSIPAFVDLLVAIVVLLVLMAIHQVLPSKHVIFAPLFLFLTLIGAMGPTLWLAALNLQYRDVKYVTPYLLQVWMFCSPVAYASNVVPYEYKALYYLNPLVGAIDGFRWSMFGSVEISVEMVTLSSVIAIFSFLTGAYYFRTMERNFADRV